MLKHGNISRIPCRCFRLDVFWLVSLIFPPSRFNQWLMGGFTDLTAARPRSNLTNFRFQTKFTKNVLEITRLSSRKSFLFYRPALALLQSAICFIKKYKSKNVGLAAKCFVRKLRHRRKISDFLRKIIFSLHKIDILF